ncbi:hypothetical protein INN71_09875 [Nocardioides sp. ChNu-153]|uniref:DUF6985 domain-containing protein n=1 Tax=unclassified Nocardioides TaxID=2615069 RepID=UPI002404F49E|nr:MULTISPECIES: hypothetical protein [unclassified Nocardioides]MDF9715715.1 hypothetical protein [Nocardioides sp. ChNu-99]MDN7121698.1 hypothetical protein [Nocardioides sp. ChNu-153]
MTHLAGLGSFRPDDDGLGWLVGEDTHVVPALGVSGRFVLDDPDGDLDAAAAVMRRLLALPAGFRERLTPFLWAYYRDTVETNGGQVALASPDQVWSQVRIGDELHVLQQDGAWYVDVESGCDWEPEHGLQVVLRDGDTLVKVGQYDGHLDHLGTDEVYPGAGHADDGSARPAWWRRLRPPGAPRRR